MTMTKDLDPDKFVFQAQVYDVRTKLHGGRIQLDFGVEALDAIQNIQKLAIQIGCSFNVVIVPCAKPEHNLGLTHDGNYEADTDYEVDPATGEIKL
jgi:hypothetical protein